MFLLEFTTALKEGRNPGGVPGKQQELMNATDWSLKAKGGKGGGKTHKKVKHW